MSEATDVLNYVSYVLDWQDRVMREAGIEVDDRLYVPPWVVGDGLIPAHRLVELLEPQR